MKTTSHRILAIWLTVAFIAIVSACSSTDPVEDDRGLGSVSQVEPTTVVTIASTETNTPAATETPEHTDTPGPSPTPSNTPSPSQTPTETPIPSATPTSRPQEVPTLIVTGVGIILEDEITLPTAVPSPVPTFEAPDEVTNVLLLGGDLGSRGDTIIIVSINHDLETASMLSIPRDTIVYEPNSIMRPINTIDDPENIKQAILYNFGIPIHYYAAVDFAGFSDIVDAIGGVDLAVTCAVRDIWKLKEPGLDPNDIDNWEWNTLEPGIYHMEGSLALWYARSRRTSTDYDRGQRQQRLLYGILNQGIELNLITQIPALWEAFNETVETDMDLGRILQLAAIAVPVRDNGVQQLYLRGKSDSWIVPADSPYLPGKQTLVPIWEGQNMTKETFQRLYLPPSLHKSSGPPITVEILNATGNDEMALLAADNLAMNGFVPIMGEAMPANEGDTALYYYAPTMKGIRYDWLLPWVVGLRRSKIELIDDQPDYPYTYQVILGDDYDPCLNPTDPNAPQAYLE